jgi:aminoglycoside phosphotransferase (APT) family kinase protein
MIDPEPPSLEAISVLLDRIAAGSKPVRVETLPGSYSNFTWLVQALDANGAPLRLVLRRYAVFGDYDLGEKASREFKTYQLLQRYGIPAPQPVYLDRNGKLFGAPSIVTSYVPGRLIESPSNPLEWARSLAIMLARIHTIPCSAEEQEFLLDAKAEATWFIRSEAAPAYMQAHPQGTIVWQTVKDLFSRLQNTAPTLVHIDYWPGNILWEEAQISAVVDWEEAAYGDPAIDVAYCCMNMALGGMPQAADEFLHTYELERDQPVANLGFWELAAAARPMIDPEDWQIAKPPGSERFTQFIAKALVRARA